VRGPLNCRGPIQGQPVILHRDVPSVRRVPAPRRAEVVLPTRHDRRGKASRADWRSLAAKHGRAPKVCAMVAA